MRFRTLDISELKIANVKLILLFALSLRLAAAVYWHQLACADSHYFRLPDSHSYWTLAEQIGSGKPYQYGNSDAQIFRTPLYPLLLTPFTWISDQYWAVLATRCVGAVLGTITVLLVIRLAERLGGPQAGITAGFMSAIYPSAVGMSITVLSEMLFMPLMIGQMLLWHRSVIQGDEHTQYREMKNTRRKRQLLGAFASGCIAGLACLTRPSWLLFTPCLSAVQILLGKRTALYYSSVAATLLGMCLTMAPWWIRNALITDKLVLTTLQVGPSLMDGLRSDASGASDSDMQFMTAIIRQQREIDQQSLVPLESTFEWRVNRLATQTAFAWANQNPARVLSLTVEKLKRIWSPWPDGRELASNAMRAAITLSCFTVVVLALTESFHLRARSRLTLAMLWLPCLYLTGLHLVFVGSIRYREPSVVLLIALACLVVARQSHYSHYLLKFRRQFQRDKVPPTTSMESERPDRPSNA